ncbi:hypothetical protein OPV22_020115 [Ensete ventricosum]|uniref:Uncharacterized protein n=1 Tax=Ensete ventricosum TaxID=4639 RepID=A0AAV8QI05_ENSVE|nr:hypothetical protein OPV22_020115 [Ensete ventricosum]
MGVASAADRGGKDDYACEIWNDDDGCLLDLRDRYRGEREQPRRRHPLPGEDPRGGSTEAVGGLRQRGETRKLGAVSHCAADLGKSSVSDGLVIKLLYIDR